MNSVKKIIIVLVCFLLFGFLPNWENEIKSIGKSDPAPTGEFSKLSTIAATPEVSANIPLPELSARSVLAFDNATLSILYSSNFDEKLPIASLTKIITALVIADSNKLNRIITVKESDIRVIGANMGLFDSERIMAEDLLKAMLVASSNDAAQVLASYYGGSHEQFVRLMNDKAKELGMINSNFSNPTGLDDEKNYSTAQDLFKAVSAFMANQVLSEMVKTKEAEIIPIGSAYSHKIKTTNKLMLEDETIIGIKTGYTDQAKGNLIIRSKKGNADVITIVLGSENREEDTKKLLDWIYKVYHW